MTVFYISLGVGLLLLAAVRGAGKKAKPATRSRAPARRRTRYALPDPVKEARKASQLAALIVKSDKLTEAIRRAEKRGQYALADALINQQETINAEIEAREGVRL